MSRRASLRAALAVVAVLGTLLGSAVPAGAASVTYPPLSATLTGPTTAGTLLSYNYTVTATGGPAEAPNGTTVGVYTYSASFLALNRTGIAFGPSTRGVLVNNTITLALKTGNVSEDVTLTVQVNSTLSGQNASYNVSLLVHVVQPYVLAATLEVGSGAGVAAFLLSVSLDGSPVGTISVSALTAGSADPVSFRYVNPNLAPGWHTFSISLAGEHGLVTFPNGADQYAQQFYVVGGGPDLTPYIFGGAATFVAAIVILVLRVGARRPRKGKK